MRVTAIAALFACATIIAANSLSDKAHALEVVSDDSQRTGSLQISVVTSTDSANELVVRAIEELTKEPEPVPAPVIGPKIHEIAPNESLTTVALKYEISWKRLFDKNTEIVHPDIVKVGDKITIPTAEEQLPDRPLPAPPVLPLSATPLSRAPAGSAPVRMGSSAGNTYTAGYCTWYVKNMRPDLPNNLGNADTWVARAAAQGLPTGSEPRVGAVGQQGMHVVFVETVNDDGTVSISEMNYRGLYVISNRTVPAGTFRYIY